MAKTCCGFTRAEASHCEGSLRGAGAGSVQHTTVRPVPSTAPGKEPRVPADTEELRAEGQGPQIHTYLCTSPEVSCGGFPSAIPLYF